MNSYREEAKKITEKLINACEKENAHILLAGLGGSYAYGTNIETSDIDIRGIYLNSVKELIGIQNPSEQLTIPDEDAIIYSLKKMMRLLMGCNPNIIEILGLRDEDYTYMSPAGRLLIENSYIYLSKAAIRTFGAYAYAQLNRLMNKSGRKTESIENNEVRSIEKMIIHTRKELPYGTVVHAYEKDNKVMLQLSADCDIEEFTKLAQNILNIHSDYRSSSRNNKAIEHGKLSKHMMHLIRLYMTGIDILEKKEIITYREKEHDLLMRIRNGEFLNNEKTAPTKDFEKVLEEYSKKFKEAAERTTLPEKPDVKAASQLMENIVKQYYTL